MPSFTSVPKRHIGAFVERLKPTSRFIVKDESDDRILSRLQFVARYVIALVVPIHTLHKQLLRKFIAIDPSNNVPPIF